MPRANRFYLPGSVVHITHRCHQREFLLKFVRDRRCWLDWLFQARQRFGLCILNYVVTSNHIHLLVQDQGHGEISRSLQLVEGCVAQAYNRRKNRRGAFWDDRYHATIVDSDRYLATCLTYIDLNMVRAGVVAHPREWREGGYWEVVHPPLRYRLTDLDQLQALLGFSQLTQLQRARADWIEKSLRDGELRRRLEWTESVAVGSGKFIARVHRKLGYRVKHRDVCQVDDEFVLRDWSNR